MAYRYIHVICRPRALYWEDVPEVFSMALGLQSRAVAYTNQDRGHSFSQYGATRANAGK